MLFDVTNSAVPRPSSKWDALREPFYFLKWKTKYHFTNLRGLKWLGRWTYLRDFCRQIRLDLSRMFWVMGNRIQQRAERRLAIAPREPSKAVFVAAHEYRPRPYPGRAMLFRCALQSTKPHFDPKLGWGDLLGDGLEICEMPGDHRDMFLEANVDLLAQQLDRALTEARTSDVDAVWRAQ